MSFRRIDSVQFSHSVVSDSLWSHGLQHTRPHYPSPTPRLYSNSCPLSQWCHPTISSSAIPFSSRLQSFPVSVSLLMSQFFTSRGQSIRVSASASVLPTNIWDWFPLGLTNWIALQSKGLSRLFSNTMVLHIWGDWYFSQQSWFQLVLPPAQRFSAYKLNKQGDNVQPWRTPFPI